MDVKRTLEHWCIVDLEHEGESTGMTVLWGVPRESKAEQWCITSMIIDIDADYVHTRNSTYRIVGQGRRMTLPIQDLPMLHKGLSPDNCISVRELRKKGYTVLDQSEAFGEREDEHQSIDSWQ